MAIPLYTNNATTTLAVAVTAADTTITVATGTGLLFPSPTGGDYAWLTLASATTTEIVKCTARTGDTFTVLRGQQSTGATTFAIGDRLDLRMTAAGLNDTVTISQAAADAALVSQSAAATSELNAATSATAASTSATTANTASTNATASQTAAATSATNAAASAASALAIYGNTAAMNAAVTSATNSATAAATSATNAAASATAASGSASTASTNSAAAVTAANNAASSSTSAAASAGTATTQATNASNSATAAATSATNASVSATNAASSVASALAVYGSIGAINTAVTNAQTAATSAGTSATNAATSASSAATQATLATTQASNASTSATAAQTSATAAANSAISASSSSSLAATSARNAAALYGSTVALSNAVTAAAGSASQAATSQSAANTSATNAAASATSAATSATSAAASAANLSAITVTGGTASLAPMAGGIPVANAKGEIRGDWVKSYPAIASTMPAITIVDYCFHLAKDDTDKGAWRKRKGQSWRSEARTAGKYMGAYTTALAAVNAQTGAVGDYFYNSTSNAFEAIATITGTVPSATAATSTATYRAGREDYPTNALVTAEAGRPILWDLDGSQPTMWAVCQSSLGTISSVAVVNNNVLIGTNGGLFVYDLNGGFWVKYTTTGKTYYTKSSFSVLGTVSWTDTTKTIVSNTVYDVAITILPDAPLDEYGMPVPTIAVATAGGVSVIQNTGLVSNIGTANVQYNISLKPTAEMFVSGVYGTTYGIWYCPNVTAPTVTQYFGTYGNGAMYQMTNINSPEPHIINSSKLFSRPSGLGVRQLFQNPADVNKCIVAGITSTYNTGWMVGDIRRSWLADGVSETVTATELVPVGVAPITSTAGWTSTATLSIVGNNLRVTANAAAIQSFAPTTMPTIVANKWYEFTVTVASASSAAVWCNLLLRLPDLTYISGTWMGSGVGPYTVKYQFKSTVGGTFPTSFFYLGIGNTAGPAVIGDWLEISNISMRDAEADRSVKAKPLSIVGSITKTATTGGRSIYSGFSAANYLQEASHADWNALGTGDFSIIMSGVKWGSAGLNRTLLAWGDGVSAGSLFLGLSPSNALAMQIHNGTTFVNPFTTTLALTDTAEHVVEYGRATINGVASTCYVKLDGVILGSGVSTLTISNTTGVLSVGYWAGGASLPWAGGSVANVRISATAPTAEQSKYIAATENALNGGQACLLSNSATVSLLDYDSQADLLEVVNGTATDFFSGLARVGSVTTTAGITGATSEGQVPKYALLKSGTTNKFWTAERNISSELQEQYKETKKTQQYSFTSSGTAWSLPKGWKAQGMAFNTTDGTFLTTATQTFDGFLWSLAGLTTAKAYQVNLVEV